MSNKKTAIISVVCVLTTLLVFSIFSYRQNYKVITKSEKLGDILAYAGGVTTFLGLSDTPSDYSGQGGKVVKVNTGATALEFGSSISTKGNWYRYNIGASQTAVALGVAGTLGPTDGTGHQVTELVMPYAGSIVAISVASNEARTGGTLTVDATINGTGSGLQAVLNVANTQYHFATQPRGVDTFTAGQRLGVKLTTDASWAPITADIIAMVIVEF